MDVDKKAAQLRKQREKICWQLNNNSDLTATKTKALEDEKAALIKEIADLENQLTPLQVTKAVTTTLQCYVSILGDKGKAFPGLCTGKTVQWTA